MVDGQLIWRHLMQNWNENADIRKALALSRLSQGIVEMLEKDRHDDHQRWLEYGQEFLDRPYSREVERRRWVDRVALAMVEFHDLRTCGYNDAMERWLETMEAYF